MRRWLAVGVLVLGLVAAGCAKRSDGGSGAGSGGADAGSAPYGVVEDPATIEAGGSASSSGGPEGPVLPAIGPQVIKSAEMRLDVKRGSFRDALRRATATAGRYGGFVASTTVEGQPEDARSGSLVLRIPSERFEAALSDLHALGTVKHETVSGEDVSQEFVDLEARLRNLRGQESVLLRLYDRAKNVADTIRIQQEVSRVQLEIEQLEGRLRFLRDRASMGTITATLVEPGAVPKPKSALHRAWQQAVDTAVAIASGLVVALGTVIPVALLLGVPALLVWRRFRPRVAPRG
jgi:hypothetical protein